MRHIEGLGGMQYIGHMAQERYLMALAGHHAQWDLIPLPPHAVLGISLHIMRELGHWKPLSPGFIERRANAYARYIKPYEAGDRGPARSHPVLDRIAAYAEDILNNSHSEHDVRLWAGEILTLVANATHPVQSRNMIADAQARADGFTSADEVVRLAEPEHQSSRRVGPPRSGDADVTRNW